MNKNLNYLWHIGKENVASIAVPAVSSFSWKLSVKSSPEKPRYIIVVFQTGANNNQERNASIFDHVNVTNMHVMLNSMQYPEKDYNISFPQHRFDKI